MSIIITSFLFHSHSIIILQVPQRKTNNQRNAAEEKTQRIHLAYQPIRVTDKQDDRNQNTNTAYDFPSYTVFHWLFIFHIFTPFHSNSLLTAKHEIPTIKGIQHTKKLNGFISPSILASLHKNINTLVAIPIKPAIFAHFLSTIDFLLS